jgi:LacI family transcriptional regulator
MVNSRDVAREAGVSQATVSRVINNNPGVNASARERVLKSMRQLGYAPNANARALITGRTNLLGLMISNITNPFYPEVVQAVAAAALKHGYNLVFCNAEEEPRLQAEYVRLLMEQRVDGIIISSLLSSSRTFVEPLRTMKQPIVLINRVMNELSFDSVTIDNVAGGRLATEHLVALGHREIAYIGGRPDTSTNRDRFRGYRQVLAEHGLQLNRGFVSMSQYSRMSGYQAMRSIIESGHLPTAAVCADDTIAFGCLDAMFDAGLSSPQDLAIIGFDDSPLASMRQIGLSSIRAPMEEMGEAAVSLLLDRISDRRTGRPKRVVFAAQLIHRSTCGCHEGTGWAGMAEGSGIPSIGRTPSDYVNARDAAVLRLME